MADDLIEGGTGNGYLFVRSGIGLGGLIHVDGVMFNFPIGFGKIESRYDEITSSPAESR